MAEILSIDFNQLPRSTRERFVAITEGRAGPAPIFQQRSGGASSAGWFLLVALFGLAVIGLMLSGFGEPYLATQSPGTLLLYVLLLFLCLLGVMGLVHRSYFRKALPYAAGAYVFPLDTVIARDRSIKLLSSREITNLEPIQHQRNGVYTHTVFMLTYSDGTRESFWVHGKAQAEASMGRLQAEGAQAGDAMQRRDPNLLYPLDPLFEARMAGFQPVDDPSGPLAKSVPGWAKKGWLVALAGACALGPMGYVARNLASDELAFNQADSAGSYQAYLLLGWRHLDEVRDEYLPRAQLREAAEKGDIGGRIAAIRSVAAGKLTPTLRAEANQALKAALHAAFEQAVGANTVAAMREFRLAYPEAEDIPAAKQRIHELFQKTLADFKPRASKPGSVPFVEALLSHMEAHDSPALEVRFRRRNSPSLVLADNVLARPDPRFDTGGELASASAHFEPADAASREGAVIDAMKKGFGGLFPTDVLPLTKGADLDPDDLRIPSSSKPSILVDYTVGWSGATYSNVKEARRFVGIVFDFDVLMTISDGGKLLKLKFKVQPPEQFSVKYDTFTNPSFGAAIQAAGQGASDSLVYEVMALRAFDQLSSKIQDEFFVSDRSEEPAGGRPIPKASTPSTGKATSGTSDAPCPGPGLTRRCSGVCVNLQEDDNNCGACGNRCSGGKHCDGHLSCRDAQGNL